MMNARNQIPKDDWVGHYARGVARVYAERSAAAASPSAASKSSSAAYKSSSAAVSSSSSRMNRNQPGHDLSRSNSSASGHGEPAASSGSSAPSAGEWKNGIRRNGAPPPIVIPPSMNRNLKQRLNHMDIERQLLMGQVPNFLPSSVNVLMYQQQPQQQQPQQQQPQQQQRHPSRMGTNAGRMNDLDNFDHTTG